MRSLDVEEGRSGPANRSTLIAVALVAAAAGAVVPPFLTAVGEWGRWIPQPAVHADYLMGVTWALALGIGILAWPVSRRERLFLLGLWAVRVFVTLGAMLLYEGMYSFLDAYSYYSDAAAGRLTIGDLEFGRGTEVVTVLSGIQTSVLDSYHALKVTYSFIGLVAVFVLYRAGVLLLKRESEQLLLILGLFPSIVFWSSILGKEPLVMLGVAMYVYGVIGWLRRRRSSYLLILCVGFLIAMSIRTWNGPILAVPLGVLLITGVKGFWSRLGLLTIAGALFVLSMRYLLGQFGVLAAQDLLEALDLYSQAWAVGGSAQEFEVDFTSPASVIAFIPRGAFTALFRPLPGEVMNPFGIVAGAENLALLVLVALAIARARLRDIGEPVVLWAGTLVLVWASLYGFISYQNLGTAVRFKLQILPVLLGLLLYLAFPAARVPRGERAGPLS